MPKSLEMLASKDIPANMGPVLEDGTVLFAPAIGSDAWRNDPARINPKARKYSLDLGE